MTVAPVADERLEHIRGVLVDDLAEFRDDQEQSLEGIDGKHVDGERRAVDHVRVLTFSRVFALRGVVGPNWRGSTRLLGPRPAVRSERNVPKGSVGRRVDLDHP